MDELSLHRITRFIGSYKETHGRDVSSGELEKAGFDASQFDYLVREGIVDRYQVTVQSGARENRFKLHRDWRSLRDPHKHPK